MIQELDLVQEGLARVHSDARDETVRQVALEQYRSWRQVGGYFDGDGNVGLEVVKYVLRFKLRFSDTWRPQIETVQSFFHAKGIDTTSL